MQSQIANLTSKTSPIVFVMIQAIDKAVTNVLRDFGEVEKLQVSRKGPIDFVSKTLSKCEETIIRSLQWARPEYAILSNEYGYLKGAEPTEEDEYLDGENNSHDKIIENKENNDGDSEQKIAKNEEKMHEESLKPSLPILDYSLDEPFNKSDTPTFVINPIDGIKNFIHGIPHFCIALALIHKDIIKASVIYDPIRNEVFWAEEGEGAWLNQHRLKPSGRNSISDAILCTGIDSNLVRENPRQLRQYYSCLAQGHIISSDIRRMASSSLDLAYIAAGRCDAFWHNNAMIWESAPGALIVKEAGGLVYNFAGKPPNFTQPTSLFASQPTLGPRLFSWLNKSFIKPSEILEAKS